ncbi:hypothetical protein F5Y15DRAFT_393750 [Xylariaceae sp. FL0016]|nr:hypothetical protein F5Y15DRAFT_393750 [Xylariaceae sp. FL0016]
MHAPYGLQVAPFSSNLPPCRRDDSLFLCRHDVYCGSGRMMNLGSYAAWLGYAHRSARPWLRKKAQKVQKGLPTKVMQDEKGKTIKQVTDSFLRTEFRTRILWTGQRNRRASPGLFRGFAWGAQSPQVKTIEIRDDTHTHKHTHARARAIRLLVFSAPPQEKDFATRIMADRSSGPRYGRKRHHVAKPLGVAGGRRPVPASHATHHHATRSAMHTPTCLATGRARPVCGWCA